MSKSKTKPPRHLRTEALRIEVEENVYTGRVAIKITLPWRKGESGCREVEIKELRPTQVARLTGDLRKAQEKHIAFLQSQLAIATGKTP